MLPPPTVERYGEILVVRDDLLPGGTKMRAIMPLIESSDAQEFVYASPAQGYAQVALAFCAAIAGRKATIFTAKRKVPHALTLRAKEAGAKVVQVEHGYLSVVSSKARQYCDKVGATQVPFGCDIPVCRQAIAAAAAMLPEPEEVWSVAGSGVLTRSLQEAWPNARFFAVVVGKQDIDTGRAERIVCPLPFERDAKEKPPFPSASNYDAKAWGYIVGRASRGALFWNVGA